MVTLTIDNKTITVPRGTTILEAAHLYGNPIPTLCYLKELNEIGSCRVCVVELEGKDKLVASCNNIVEDGMVVYTNSPKVRQARRTNVEFILSQHDCKCTTCVRSGNCNLQKISNDLGIIDTPYRRSIEKQNFPKSFPLIRDSRKCIKCLRCVQVCEKIQTLGIWDMANSGARCTVDVSYNGNLDQSNCVLCGQCATHCPTGALRERDDTDKAFEALADPNKITVIQIAPAVRAAWGESLGISREFATEKRLVSALRQIGFDYIFDTNFSADLTILEEGSEFVKRFTDGEENKFPLFTSCCPGWIRFIKSQYPELVDNLSTAKSPQQMFGAVAKSYYANLLDVSPENIYCISVMPCIAKKQECAIPVMNDACGEPDVDLVLTTREIDRIIRAEHIIVKDLKEEEFDSPLGISTGAGVIFGATGGVMEAALRSAHYLITGRNPEPDAFKAVRGNDGWRSSTIDIDGTEVKVAVAHGLGNARSLIEALKTGKVTYDFVEIMACPGGCVGGGGQPIKDNFELADVRAANLYKLDKESSLRFSHENPSITAIYENYLSEPLSKTSHHLLHTDHNAWDMPL